MQHTSYIEISKPALKNNIKFINELLGDDVIFSSVVKGNAYGHGLDPYCRIALECGVKHFSTFSAAEAATVLEVTKCQCPIMIMGMIDKSQLEWAIENNIEFFVFNQKRLQETISTAQKIRKKAIIHLEIETGMNRTGFSLKILPEILELIKGNAEHIFLKGVCTHFAGAESVANYHRIKAQQSKFKRALEKISAKQMTPPQIHMACSAATIRYPSSRHDLVRIGILQYGFFPTDEILVYYLSKHKVHEDPIKRLMTWKSKVMDVKFVKAGEFIGYGTSYFANADTKIALVPVGYSHGFNRSLSNQGRVLIRGKRLKVIGAVNMNMMSIDVTGLDNIELGDEVVLIGKQGDAEISVASFSDFSNLVNYELLTRLPHDIPRIVVE